LRRVVEKLTRFQKMVLREEHKWQPIITNMVVSGEISWDGKNRDSLKVSENYEYL